MNMYIHSSTTYAEYGFRLECISERGQRTQQQQLALESVEYVFLRLLCKGFSFGCCAVPVERARASAESAPRRPYA